MKGTVDRIICDPPFLSEECQTKGRSHLVLFVFWDVAVVGIGAVAD